MKRIGVLALVFGLIAVLGSSALQAQQNFGRVELISRMSRGHLQARNSLNYPDYWPDDMLTWGLPTATDAENSALDLSFQWEAIRYSNGWAFKCIWNGFYGGQGSNTYYLVRTLNEDPYDYHWKVGFAMIPPEEAWMFADGLPEEMIWQLKPAVVSLGRQYYNIVANTWNPDTGSYMDGYLSVASRRTSPFYITDTFYGSDFYTHYHTFGLSNAEFYFPTSTMPSPGSYGGSQWQLWWYSED